MGEFSYWPACGYNMHTCSLGSHPVSGEFSSSIRSRNNLEHPLTSPQTIRHDMASGFSQGVNYIQLAMFLSGMIPGS